VQSTPASEGGNGATGLASATGEFYYERP
jgi:hypothetical protein